ncbi:MAG: 50S ribosomal protein L17 [Deltaproteobacteria bacterium]|jgi:large subunit ribosomal protein L17|nr:50S ribosomal protein L17 [Deltaproteobacteria bacterium]
MRHHVDKRKLNRTTSHRKAMLANMATSLVLHDRIETTLPKAKELRRVADRLVTLGKKQTLHARRKALSMIKDKNAVHKLFAEIAGRFEGRNGGYTRIYKLGFRHGDDAPMAVIEYLQKDEEKSEKTEKKTVKTKAKAKAEKAVKKTSKPAKKASSKKTTTKKSTAKKTTTKKKTTEKKTKKS